MQNKGRIS